MKEHESFATVREAKALHRFSEAIGAGIPVAFGFWTYAALWLRLHEVADGESARAAPSTNYSARKSHSSQTKALDPLSAALGQVAWQGKRLHLTGAIMNLNC